jgi:hypothetical protein
VIPGYSTFLIVSSITGDMNPNVLLISNGDLRSGVLWVWGRESKDCLDEPKFNRLC